MIRNFIVAAALALVMSACAPRPPRYEYAVLFVVPSDPAAFSGAAPHPR